LTTSLNFFGLPSASSDHAGENTGRPPTLKIVSAVRSLRSKRIVRGSSTVALATPSSCVRVAGETSLLVSISNTCATSAAVTGSPLMNRARGWIGRRPTPCPGATWMSSAASVHRVRLVAGTLGERLEHQRGEAGGRLTLDGVGVVLVEARPPVGVVELQRAALGRLRVDVFEVREAARIPGLAVGRVGVRPAVGGRQRAGGRLAPRQRPGREGQRAGEDGPEHEEMRAPEGRPEQE
jgi:hypothetical protein